MLQLAVPTRMAAGAFGKARNLYEGELVEEWSI
jgi:hypothetical protein